MKHCRNVELAYTTSLIAQGSKDGRRSEGMWSIMQVVPLGRGGGDGCMAARGCWVVPIST